MLSDELTIIDKLKKRIDATLQNIGDSMITGGVDSMEKYQYMLGQIRTYESLLQEISTLLDKKEQNEKGTVVSIKSKSDTTQ